MSGRSFVLSVVTTLCVAWTPLFAVSSTTNRLDNPQFETTVNGWEAIGGTTHWDSRRDSATLTGGSLRFDGDALLNGTEGVGARQCIPLRGGMEVQFGGRVMIPSGQTRAPVAGFSLYFLPASEPCGGVGTYATTGTISAASYPLDTWTTLVTTATAPAGTDKVAVYLYFAAGPGTGVGQALYDTTIFITTRARENDLTNDTFNDLLWRNPSTGQNVWWSMSGATREAYGSLLSVPGTDWSLAGSGYFDTGYTPDLLWRNAATGQNVVWKMDGTTRTSYTTLLTVPPPWRIGAIESFDNDDDMDIVWRNPSTGENVLWTMQGTTRLSYTPLLSVPGAEWEIAGAGDMNGDRKADLVWRNYTTGANVIWFMNGATRLSWAYTLGVTGSDWRIVAVSDMDFDGLADLVWRNQSTGQNVIWFMSGHSRTGFASILAVPDPDWELQGSR